jgi:cytidylate kinase
MPIITISRQTGSLGTEIIDLLSKESMCQCLNKESLEAAFGEYGVPRESVERYDEKKPGFWDLFKTDKARYLHFVKGAILEYAGKGNGIILGRGGQVLLAGLPGILHVRVIAPMDVRIKRIVNQYRCDEDHARQIIRSSDHERAGFHKFFFGVDWEDFNLYDLVINTGSFSARTTVKLIKNIVDSDEFKAAQAETALKLKDLCLEHEIKTAVIYKEKIVVQFLEVTVDRETITLRGIVDNNEDLERCEKIAAALQDDKKIQNEIYYNPITTAYGLHY